MIVNYKKLANDCRKIVLGMIHKGGTSHIASNFSVIDIAIVLYENLKEEDEVVWSKGWVAATIYYFLAKQGKIPIKDLDKFPNSPYLGLAETSVNGVHVSGGSMGHGLPIAVGMALGKKLAGEKGTIYCIMSDGEMNEGTTWESAMLAAHHKLNNLVVLVDANGWQAMGKTQDVLFSNHITWTGFNWNVYRGPGHDYKFIEKTIYSSGKNERPTVMWLNTIKGKGVSFFENHLLYHYKHVEKDEFEKAMAELKNAV